jgi:hypothetical protein
MQSTDSIPQKSCSSCPEGQQWHPATPEFFPRNSYKKDGLRSQCKECWNKRRKERYSHPEAKEQELAQQKEHRSLSEVKVQARVYKKEYNKRPEVIKKRQTYRKGKASSRNKQIQLTYSQLFEWQGGVCAICRKPEMIKDQSGNIRCLALDHNHETGEIRGLLCFKCNTNLALLENESFVNAAQAYLNLFTLRPQDYLKGL